jgi:hypothetical protein
MPSERTSPLERELYELKGGLDRRFALREEFEQRVGEAQDGSKREALENVLAHIEALEGEYRIRQQNSKRSGASPDSVVVPLRRHDSTRARQ